MTVKGAFTVGDDGDEYSYEWSVVSWRDHAGNDRKDIDMDDLNYADSVTVKVEHGENDKYVQFYGPFDYEALDAEIEYIFDGDEEDYTLH